MRYFIKGEQGSIKWENDPIDHKNVNNGAYLDRQRTKRIDIPTPDHLKFGMWYYHPDFKGAMPYLGQELDVAYKDAKLTKKYLINK